MRIIGYEGTFCISCASSIVLISKYIISIFLFVLLSFPEILRVCYCYCSCINCHLLRIRLSLTYNRDHSGHFPVFLLSHQTFEFLSTWGVTSLIAHILLLLSFPFKVLHGAMKIITFQTTNMYCLNLLLSKNIHV